MSGDTIIPFEDDEDFVPIPFVPLGSGAPAWADRLYRDVHELRETQRKDRHEARNRDMVILGNLRSLTEAVGKPADSEGHGATGLRGDIRALDRRLKPFESLRDKGLGAAASAVLFLGVLWWAWQERLAGVLK